MFRSIRLRLTLWYLLFCTLLLVGFSGFLYTLLGRNFYQQLDASLDRSARTAAGLFADEVKELQGDIAGGAAETLREFTVPMGSVAIFDGNQLLASGNPEIQKVRGLTVLLEKAGLTNRSLVTTAGDLGPNGARIIILPVPIGGHRCFVIVTESLDSIRDQLTLFRRILYLALSVTLLLAGFGGLLLARKSLAPIVAISEQAERIGAENLHERLQIGEQKDELGRLAAVFNRLLSRLEQSFLTQQQFMADASHELRTPLAVIQGEADVSLSQDRPPAEYRESLGIISDEARRLARLVDDLLHLARADTGHRELNIEEFYLNDLLEECSRSARTLAEGRGILLTLACTGDQSFRGDQELIRRMVLNLLDNAIRYTPPGGTVSLRLEAQEDNASIIVADTGIGISADSVSRVFDRFYRVNPARSRANGGFGLGLSIVKWIAELHNGSVRLTSAPGIGSTFIITLPLHGTPVPTPNLARV